MMPDLRADAPPPPKLNSQPPPSPTSAYRWSDIEGFASASELEEASKDPSRLNMLLAEKVGNLRKGGERAQSALEFIQDLQQDSPAIWELLTETIRNGGNIPDRFIPKQHGVQQGGAAQTPPSGEVAQLRQEIHQLKQAFTGQNEGHRRVQELVKKYPDATAHFPVMEKIMQEHPGTDLAFAYQHAKLMAANAARMGGGNQAQNSPPPVSERPTAGVGPTSREETLKALGSEIRAMRHLPMEDRLMHAAQKQGFSI